MSRAACKAAICAKVAHGYLDAYVDIIDKGQMEVDDMRRLNLILDQVVDALSEFGDRWLGE